MNAAIDAARAGGRGVEIGPFGSSCEVDIDAVGTLVGSISDAAFAHGATHVTVHVARDTPTAPSRFEIPIGGIE